MVGHRAEGLDLNAGNAAECPLTSRASLLVPHACCQAASLSFLMPSACMTSFSYTGSALPRFILRMK